ncbi:MAG: sigma-54-dependent Fis family transcriptional regulator [Desulfovibrio sp.]|jgi:transcriptional regulator of acetoin/glycerol metabolism|nr:sigma-54-dependent Fis family transcriptional regulator [Desulfovibrio sp.]
MYVLERNGDVFQVRREKLGQAPGRPPGYPLTGGDRGGRAQRLDVWKSFIDTGVLDDPTLPDGIASSWRRCRDRGVDPLQAKCEIFAPISHIEPQVELYGEIATDVERQVYGQIKDRGLLITVAEASGKIIRTCGSKGVLSQADRLHFGPGAVWSEESVGTNAICLALDDGVPAQVMGEEHFCNSHQTWGCTAAPIFTPFGDLWGCFDLSGPTDADHSQALWLVIGAAREIERQLLRASMTSMENRSRELLATLFGAMPVGVLMVDDDGLVTYANTLAEHMLKSPGGVRGTRADAYFDYAGYALQMEGANANAQSVPLRCTAARGIHAEAIPFIAARSDHRYAIITLQTTAAPRRPAPQAPRTRTSPPSPFDAILHRGRLMADVVEQARHMAKGPGAILLLGETGTGKELFARAIHESSRRADGPFVAVNCGAIPKDLIQSELFGYERGAFTGATDKTRAGKFELADKGTLFLDEISEMPMEMQVNLLRPLEERTVTRVGGKREIEVDFRLITATNRDLSQRLTEGRFREDLYYRINVLALEIPPLRERREDVMLIAEDRCRRLCRESGIPYCGIAPETVRLLEGFDWPGNVRQLVHAMEYAVNMAQGACILPEHLPPQLLSGMGRAALAASPDAAEAGAEARSGADVPDAGALAGGEGCNWRHVDVRGAAARATNAANFDLETMEAQTICAALNYHKGNILQAAKALGIGRNTLYAKLRKIEGRSAASERPAD